MKRKRLPYPAAILLSFLVVALSVGIAAFYATAEPVASGEPPTTAVSADPAIDASTDIGSIVQIMQGFMDSYKNDLSTQVGNHYDSLAILLSVAAAVFGLFGVAVPLINYAYSRDDKKEVQASLKRLDEASERSEKLEAQLNEANGIIAALNTSLDSQQLQFQKTQNDFNDRMNRMMEQWRDLSNRMALSEKQRASGDDGRASAESLPIQPISDSDKDKADAFYKEYLSASLGSAEELAAITKAIEFDPRKAKYYHGRAGTLHRMERYEDALKDRDKAIELNPGNALYYQQRAITLHAMQRYDDALKDYDKAIELDPDKADYYHGRAVTLHEMKRYDDALKDRDKAIELDPSKADYYHGRAVTLHSMKRYTDALKDRNKAIELDPENALYYDQRAITLHTMQRYEDALKDYDKAIDLDLSKADYYYERAVTLYAMKRYDDALKDRDKALELAPNNPKYYTSRATTYRALARTTEDPEQKEEYERLAREDDATAERLSKNNN